MVILRSIWTLFRGLQASVRRGRQAFIGRPHFHLDVFICFWTFLLLFAPGQHLLWPPALEAIKKGFLFGRLSFYLQYFSPSGYAPGFAPGQVLLQDLLRLSLYNGLMAVRKSEFENSFAAIFLFYFMFLSQSGAVGLNYVIFHFCMTELRTLPAFVDTCLRLGLVGSTQ